MLWLSAASPCLQSAQHRWNKIWFCWKRVGTHFHRKPQIPQAGHSNYHWTGTCTFDQKIKSSVGSSASQNCESLDPKEKSLTLNRKYCLLLSSFTHKIHGRRTQQRTQQKKALHPLDPSQPTLSPQSIASTNLSSFHWIKHRRELNTLPLQKGGSTWCMNESCSSHHKTPNWNSFEFDSAITFSSCAPNMVPRFESLWLIETHHDPIDCGFEHKLKASPAYSSTPPTKYHVVNHGI
jgi:hypothetical protein